MAATAADRLSSIVRLSGASGRWLTAFALFLAAAVVQTWPLVPHIGDSVIDYRAWPFDSWDFLWDLWWVKHALVDLQTNPYQTDHLYYPGGTELYLHTLAPVLGVLSIPLQLVTGNLVLSWNLLLIGSFVASALAMYALAHRVTSNHAAALISGYIFAFAPFFFLRTFGQGHLLMTWPIPLIILFVIRFRESGRLREAAAAGILWSVLTYNAQEYGVEVGLFLGLFVAYWSFIYLRRRDQAGLLSLARGTAAIAGVWLLASLPLLIPTIRSVYGGEYSLSGQDEYFSADLLGYVTPSPLWGPGVAPELPAAAKSPIGAWETTVFLGITPLILAVLALPAARRSPQRVLLWAIVFLVFATLALGPNLYVGDTKSLSVLGVSFTVPLPYQIYDRLPLVSVGRVPARMIVLALVGLAVLAGAGFDAMASRLPPRYGALAPLAAVAVLGLVALEYWNPPVEVSKITAPAVFSEIRDEPGDFSVLHAPWGRLTGQTGVGFQAGGPIAVYYGRIHEKRTFGGYLSRVPEDSFSPGPLGEEPGLGYLGCPSCMEPRPQDLNADDARRVFSRYAIRYIVLHRADPYGGLLGIPAENLQAMDDYLRTAIGLTPVYSDASLTVYRNGGLE